MRTEKHILGRREPQTGGMLAIVIGMFLVPIIACSDPKPPPPPDPLGITETLASPPVQVLVGKEILQEGVKYSYYVVNGSAFPIVGVVVGFDDPHGIPELTESPVGWDGETVPGGSEDSPPGWEMDAFAMEEEANIFIAWSIDTAETESWQIIGGQSLGGFEVLVPQEDAAYETGHWSVYLNAAAESAYYWILEPLGTVSTRRPGLLGQTDIRLAPNPASDLINIRFDLPVTGEMDVDVFNVGGRQVRRLFHANAEKGSHSWSWDGRNSSGQKVSAGTYFIRIRYSGGQRFAKFTRVR